jgi:hypothetical protein
MRTARLVAAVLIAAGTAACSGAGAWDRANRDALRRDVVQLFQRHGVTAAPECHMIGTTRDAYCVFKAPADRVDSLVRALKLEAAPTGSAAHEQIELIEMVSPGGCRATPALADPSKVRAYRSERRPRELALASGGAFEYLVLYQHTDSDDVCVRVSYAYG